MSKVIYCISGLGADEKIFDRLELNGYELRFIPWLRPGKDESLEDYATRMARPIAEENSILLGVSFGGMVSIEIARQRPLKKLILISSIKSVQELPRWMRVAGKLKLNKMLPIRSYSFTERVDNDRLGVSTEEEREMVRAYRKASDSVYLEWAINQVLNWKNEWVPDNIVHIHGDSDKIFPLRKIKADYVVKGATHLMVYNRAAEVSEYIRKELQ